MQTSCISFWDACVGWCHVLLGFQHVVSSLHLVLESTAHALWFVDHAQDKQSAQPSRKEKTSPCGILKETLKKAKHLQNDHAADMLH